MVGVCRGMSPSDKSSDDSYYGKWDLMFVICPVKSRNNLFKWSCHFNWWKTLTLRENLLSLMVSGILMAEKKIF